MFVGECGGECVVPLDAELEFETEMDVGMVDWRERDRDALWERGCETGCEVLLATISWSREPLMDTTLSRGLPGLPAPSPNDRARVRLRLRPKVDQSRGCVMRCRRREERGVGGLESGFEKVVAGESRGVVDGE